MLNLKQLFILLELSVRPMIRRLFHSLLFLAFIGCASTLPPANTVDPETGLTLRQSAWVDSLMQALTIEQKVAQLFMTSAHGRFYSVDDPAYQRLLDRVEQFEIGGVIFLVGHPQAQALMTNALQRRSRLPLLIAQDMEWGVGMRLDRATTFPRAMALGATRNPDLAFAMGQTVAAEARALGVHMNYAPVADINNNPFNPVINVRSYGENPALVSAMNTAYIRGMQAGGLFATAKHFPGHGDTAVDSHADLPVLNLTRARLDSLELTPFREAIEAGVTSIMVAHLALPNLEPDPTVPASLSPRIVTDLLRKDLGFEGLIVTDAMNMEGVTKYFGVGEAAVRCIEAGVDQVLMSRDEYAAQRAILNALASGRLTQTQIDASVKRILTTKARLNLLDQRLINPDALPKHIGRRKHRLLNNAIARQSLTLLRNEKEMLPLNDPTARILVVTLNDTQNPQAGRYFVQQLKQQGHGNKIEHRVLDVGSSSRDFAQVRAYADQFDIVLAPAYVRVRSGTGRIALNDQQQRFLNALVQKGKPVILMSLGNPYIILNLEPPDAYLAAYSGAESSQRAMAQAIFGRASIGGKLPVTIPDLYPYGAGLNLPQSAPRLDVPSTAGMNETLTQRVDSLMKASIADKAFPAAAVAIGRHDVTAHLKGYGYLTYDSDLPVSSHSLFDLASLTKVLATTPSIMKLFEEGKLNLDAPLATYLPEFGQNGKEQVTVRQILTHTAGLKSFYQFYDEGITDREDIISFIQKDDLKYTPDAKYVYSDLGMMMLALAVERISGKPFNQYVKETFYQPMGMGHTGFRPAFGQGKDTHIVPSEVDDVFRNELVQGEVHDERAWMLGGTAGHAGLFSCAHDLALFAQMMLNGGTLNGKRFFEEETIRLFTTKFENELDHTRALGWDTKSPEGYSSAGQHFGPRSFGHTGFTGTSFWIDPDADLFVILLTNRVYPTRNNRKHIPIRPALADIAYKSVIGLSGYRVPSTEN